MIKFWIYLKTKQTDLQKEFRYDVKAKSTEHRFRLNWQALPNQGKRSSSGGAARSASEPLLEVLKT